jgi:hypothetical protein
LTETILDGSAAGFDLFWGSIRVVRDAWGRPYGSFMASHCLFQLW